MQTQPEPGQLSEDHSNLVRAGIEPATRTSAVECSVTAPNMLSN